MTRLFLTWFFWGGFVFLISVGVWTIVTVQAMKRFQAEAIANLQENTQAKQALQRVLEIYDESRQK